MEKNLICGECGGEMKLGYIPESVGLYKVAYWIEGDPLGLNLFTLGKQAYLISAYRCEACGLLKFYAPPENKI